MVYPIYVYGSSILSKVAEPVKKDHENLKQFVDDMFETMYASDGVGLAAPQVGKSIRIFTIDTTPSVEDDEKGIKRAFINPEIYWRSEDEDYYHEGCLSIPGINEDVLRPVKVRIRYFDENFEPHDEEYDGVAARVIQHEYDHLEGKVFVEKVSPLRKQLLKSKLQKMAKGDYRSRYACKQVK